jgi:hypothetical protein
VQALPPDPCAGSLGLVLAIIDHFLKTQLLEPQTAADRRLGLVLLISGVVTRRVRYMPMNEDRFGARAAWFGAESGG